VGSYQPSKIFLGRLLSGAAKKCNRQVDQHPFYRATRTHNQEALLSWQSNITNERSPTSTWEQLVT
jgi:hypothetical protein